MAEIEKLVGLTITGIDIHKGAEDGTGFLYLNAVGADETPDVDDEIYDYKTSKPFVEKWSEEASESTRAAGQAISYGNVRAQHGNQGSENAAGTICEPIEFDDKNKSVKLRVKVVDGEAIKKVNEGVYRGMSIRGRLVGKKWRDGEFYRYTVDPVEFSLVDKPANPSATITVVKADGTTEVVKVAEEKQTKRRQIFLRDKTLLGAKEIFEILKAAGILEDEQASEEIEEMIPMKTEVEKAATTEEVEKASAISRMKAARKAHDENSACLSGYCGHESAEKCAEKVAENHKIIHAAFQEAKKSASADGAEKAAKEKEGEETEEEKKAREKKEAEAKSKKEKDEEEEKAEKKKSAEISELKATVAQLADTVAKMADGKNVKRPIPVHPGSAVVTKADDQNGEKDLIEKKGALDKNAPDYIDKSYQIDRAAEPEMVKL